MFGSKRRKAASSRQPLNGQTANPAATIAATSVFLKNQSSSTSLSSAAAAAALKARPMSPTSVADVQTKRTLRRAGSTSSAGSSINGSQRSATPQLERRLSSGSMTERTFRDPSPARHVPSAPDAPPVPAIPAIIPTTSHRRAASTEAPPMRVASPVSRNPVGRGSSLGPHGTAVTAMQAGQRANRSSSSELTGASQRRGSVNFSYPTNSRPNSPTQKRLTSPSPLRQNPVQITTSNNQSLVYDPNTRSFLPAAEIRSLQEKIDDVANHQVGKKKKTPPVNATGSHLADKTVGGRPKGTAVDAIRAAERQAQEAQQAKRAQQHQQHQQQQQQQQQQTQQQTQQQEQQQQKHHEQTPVIVKPPSVEQKVATQPGSSAVNQPIAAPPPVEVSQPIQTKAPAAKEKNKPKQVSVASEDEGHAPISKTSEEESNLHNYSPRSFPLLGKKPSIVQEDQEGEELEADAPRRSQPKFPALNTRMIDRNISPSPLPRSKAGRGHGRDLTVIEPAPEPQRSVSQPPPTSYHTQPIVESTPISKGDSVRGPRVSSLSPGRTARFSTTPDSLIVKHQPPPRSISPRKSALKHSNSRNSSPMTAQGSETSNSPGGPDDQPLPRKKSVRVSFDESNVVVGDAAQTVTTDSPITSSPQVSKRPWYSIGRGKKKESIVTDSEEDEVMKPRPALPSFGSVRERKNNRDIVEERPLVKPVERNDTKSGVRSPQLPSPINELNEYPMGQSNDHIVGAVLAQDQQMKNAANISKSREPLPPQVTSVEGSGYYSDSDNSVSAVETGNVPVIAKEPEVAPEPRTESEIPAVSREDDKPKDAISQVVPPATQDSQQSSDTEDAPTPTQEAPNGTIPKIAVSQATPTTEQTEEKKEWLGVPGSWDNTSESDNDEPRHIISPTPEAPTPAVAGIAEPAPERQAHASPKIEAEHIYSATIAEETEESEADVFSDAAEELTDSDHEGFISLNAVVESPITTAASTIPQPPESPTTKIARERAQLSISKSVAVDNSTPADWNQAQQYWSSLSAEKKRQMELDAMRKDDSSDTEVEAKPVPKPKAKKKIVRADPPAPVVPNERTYMIQPGSKAGPGSYQPMRTSMRTEAPSSNVDTGMRKSMRGPGQGSMRDSMRSAGGATNQGSVQKKARPVSLPVESRADPAANKHSRNLSSASAAAASNTFKAPVQPTLRRKNSSDSESSFKRTRPANKSMLRTMRTGNNADQQPNSGRLSIRSLSPTGSVTRRPFGGFSQPAENQTHMRMSMRGSAGAAPTMRGSAGRAKSPSGGSIKLGFGFSNKSAKPQKTGRTFGSRFADSSDEDEPRPTFRSRFADSSDESDDDIGPPRPGALGRSLRSSAPAPAAAPASKPSNGLLGIPKRSGVDDGDSSDLPDSDDEKPGASNNTKLSKKRQTNGAPVLNGNSQGAALASTTLRRSGSGRGTMTTVTSPGARPAQKRRGSIMSILRRKKDDNSKVRKSDAESPARRDTPLERSRTDLLALRSDSTAQRPQSPKLQKRNPMSRENSHVPSSPVTPATKQTAPVVNDDDRPHTADGVNGITGAEAKEMGLNGADAKPDIGTRRYTADAVGSIGFDSPAKKKKKFGTLRRMFGIHD